MTLPRWLHFVLSLAAVYAAVDAAIVILGRVFR